MQASRFFTGYVQSHPIYEFFNPLKIHPLRHLASFQPSLAFLLLLWSTKKAQSLLKKVLIVVLIHVNGFCYDVTIKLYQHHVIKKVMHAVDTCRMLSMYSMYFVVVTLLFYLLVKIVQLLYHVSNLLTIVCKHVNDLSVNYSRATPHPNC